MNRIGSYIQTFTGTLFYPLDPRPEEVYVTDIAHALSNCCRWTGHTKTFYSVAQHAVMVSEMVNHIAPHLARAALHHDSAEAYLADICSPTKQYLRLRYENYAGVVIDESFSQAEDRVEGVIFDALGIVKPDSLGKSLIKTADRAALRIECENLMNMFPSDDWLYTISIPKVYWDKPWEPEYAKTRFLQQDKDLTPSKV